MEKIDRPRIGVFCAIVDNVERRNENGSSDLLVYQQACAEYEVQYKLPFMLDSCWQILKDQFAWKDVEMPSF